MAHLIGEPRNLQDCKPGDLIRVAHRDGSRFAFAISGNASGVVDRVVIQDRDDAFPMRYTDGTEPTICYGRRYFIREGFAPDAFVHTGRSQPGAIGWRSSAGESTATLVVSDGGSVRCVDLNTGQISSPRGGPGSISRVGP